MSADVAVLGLAVDSRPVTQATTALGQFAAAAKPADQAAKALTTSHAGMSAQAQAAFHSTRSLIEAMAAGVPVSTALSQQLSHLSFAAASPSGIVGSFKQAGAALLGMVSPTALVVAGLGAVAVAGVVAIHSIAETEKQFDDASRAAGTTVRQLHDLASAAEFKGIDNADFLKGIQRFSSDVEDAKNNFGELATLLRANGQSASSFQDAFAKVADLIKNASNDQQRLQLLQQAGLPPTMDWVRFMQQGSAGIRQATAEATKFGETADQALIAKARAFDEAWAKTWANFRTGSKNAILGASDYLASLNFKVNAALMKAGVNVGKNLLTDAARGGSTPSTQLTTTSPVDDFYKGLGTGAPGNAAKKTINPRDLLPSIQLQQQSISLLGQTASASQAVRQVELQVQAARLNGVHIDQQKVEALKQLAYEQALGITQIKAQTDAENVAAGAIGLSAGEAAKYTAVQTALNNARREGKTLTDADVQAINANATALGQAAQNTENLKFAYDNLVQGPMEAFTSALVQGKSAMDSMRAAGTSMLNAIAKKAADVVASAAWKALTGGFSFSFGGSATTAASTVATVGHTGMGPGERPASRVLPSAIFDTAPRFHGGIGPGEQAAVIRTDESVLTPGQMKQLGTAGGFSMGDTNIVIQGNADDKAQQAIARELAAHRKQIAAIVSGQTSNARYQATGVY